MGLRTFFKRAPSDKPDPLSDAFPPFTIGICRRFVLIFYWACGYDCNSRCCCERFYWIGGQIGLHLLLGWRRRGRCSVSAWLEVTVCDWKTATASGRLLFDYIYFSCVAYTNQKNPISWRVNTNYILPIEFTRANYQYHWENYVYLAPTIK
jgi:hypothetical protein